MMRVKRRIWLAGQFVFGQLVGVTCLGFFAGKFSCGLEVTLARQNQWSEFMTDTYERFPKRRTNDCLFWNPER